MNQPAITNYGIKQGSSSAKKWKKTSPNYVKATSLIAEWFCTNSRPTFMIQDEGLIALLNFLVPEFDIPSRFTISRNIMILYKEYYEETKVITEDISDCAITTDGGSSSNSVSFLEVGVHWIDGETLTLNSMVLAVRENKDQHTAENYKEVTKDVIEEFHLTDKVRRIITDNEPKMKAAFQDERNGCMAHMLHNSITHGIKENEFIVDVIKKCRNVAGKHNRSYALRYALQEEQKKLKITERVLLQDVSTRWNSVKVSLSSFLDHKDDIVGAEDESFKNFDAVNNAILRMKWKKDVIIELLFSLYNRVQMNQNARRW